MTFYEAFIDELRKIGAEQLAQTPIPEKTQRDIFKMGPGATEFEKGQRAKELRRLANPTAIARPAKAPTKTPPPAVARPATPPKLPKLR
jgi:hypothetical protein